MSSTDQLTQELIDALDREKAAPVRASHDINSLLEIDGAQLGAILGVNRETLIRQNMVEKGHTQAQAEEDVNNLFLLADCVKQATLSLGSEHSHPQAKLELRLGLPGPKSVEKARAAANP